MASDLLRTCCRCVHCETLAPTLDDLAQRVCAADADDADASVGGGADSQRRAAPLVAMIDVDANDLPERYELGRVPAVALLRAHRPGHPLVYAGKLEGEPLFEWLRSVARAGAGAEEGSDGGAHAQLAGALVGSLRGAQRAALGATRPHHDEL